MQAPNSSLTASYFEECNNEIENISKHQVIWLEEGHLMQDTILQYFKVPKYFIDVNIKIRTEQILQKNLAIKEVKS